MTPLILAFMLAAPAPKSEPKSAETADHPLVGDWAVESHISSGKPIARLGESERIKITRDRWKIGLEGRTESCLAIDPKKDPPHIDVWVPTQGNEEPAIARGIYKLDGDQLTVCYRLNGNRPTKFESLPKSSLWLMTLKRSKKK